MHLSDTLVLGPLPLRQHTVHLSLGAGLTGLLALLLVGAAVAVLTTYRPGLAPIPTPTLPSLPVRVTTTPAAVTILPDSRVLGGAPTAVAVPPGRPPVLPRERQNTAKADALQQAIEPTLVTRKYIVTEQQLTSKAVAPIRRTQHTGTRAQACVRARSAPQQPPAGADGDQAPPRPCGCSILASGRASTTGSTSVAGSPQIEERLKGRLESGGCQPAGLG